MGPIGRREDMIGEQLGALKIIAELGSGGMGTVYLGEHVVLKDKRAVKLLSRQFTDVGPIVARFVDEARAMRSRFIAARFRSTACRCKRCRAIDFDAFAAQRASFIRISDWFPTCGCYRTSCAAAWERHRCPARCA
jgi:serine/threonine protein kinase